MITASVQKSGKPLSPYSLHPCGLNDKSLPEYDIICAEEGILHRSETAI
ncbi:MAG: hypothetical protein V7K64_08095 [Nostoc sp.]